MGDAMNERIKDLGIQAGGIWIEHATAFLSGTLNLERFAELVRQDERDKHAEQIKNLKDICMVAGFLLNKLNITCAMSFGMQEQVHNCINDCNNVIDTKNNHEQD